jgi:hypothetical protein
MIISSISPAGIITTLALDTLSAWRLELGVVGSQIGVAIRYVTATPQGTALGMIAALDTENDEANAALKLIAKAGFPRGTLEGDKERFHESLKSLYNINTMKPQTVDVLLKKGTTLAVIYHDLKRALFTTGEHLNGRYEGWQWAVYQKLGEAKWPEAETPGNTSD